MTWQDRLREAAYTSPSGQRFTFAYENVSKSVSKKTAAFNFPDADGTFIQDLGHTGRRYPLRLFFWGDDYDQETDAFEEALLERGTGKLEHPIYGTVNVVPFGDITRRDDLKTAANQAVLEVKFWETLDILYPTAQVDAADAVISAVEEYNTAASEQFNDTLDLDTASEVATFKNRFQLILDTTHTTLQGIADTEVAVSRKFDAVYDSINTGIDTLVSHPLVLAIQTIVFTQTPARALTSILARLNAYGSMASSLTDTIRTPSLDSENANAFINDDLYASTAITGSIVAAVNNQFETKPDALAAAEVILDLLEEVTNWRDLNFNSLELIDTGQSYQQLQEAVALTAGFLVEISFSLKQERHIVLDRARTIIDLASELYGEVDSQLDFLITSNNLSGSEILELPEGKDIVYFI